MVEIVLLGVSRTFKTPLSIYLAFKGWFVANVPIVLGIELPAEVFDLPSGRVFGLMTEPEPLISLRQVRLQLWKGADGDYIKKVNLLLKSILSDCTIKMR